MIHPKNMEIQLILHIEYQVVIMAVVIHITKLIMEMVVLAVEELHI